MARTLRARYRDERLAPVHWDDPAFWNVEARPEERCQYLAVELDIVATNGRTALRGDVTSCCLASYPWTCGRLQGHIRTSNPAGR